MKELGIHCLALASEWKPGYAPEFAERLGNHDLDLAELPLLDPGDLDWKATRSVLEKHRLRATFSLVLPYHLDVVERPDEAADFVAQVLTTADKAGSKIVTGVTYSKLGQMNSSQPSQKELDAVCRLLDKSGKHAKSLGMRLGVEAVNRYENKWINTAGQAFSMIERTGSDGLMIHLDTYHMNIEEISQQQGFVDAGELLGYVHLSESNRGTPGKGTVAWDQVFEGLKDVGYEGSLVLEAFPYMFKDLAGALAIWRPVAEDPKAVVDDGVPFIKKQAQLAGYAT